MSPRKMRRVESHRDGAGKGDTGKALPSTITWLGMT